MKLHIAGIAFQIIEDHHEALRRFGIEIGEQSHHAGAIDKISAARDIIGEHGLDRVALGFGILAAAMLLAIQARTIGFLFLAGNPAVNQGFLRFIHQ